MGRLLEKEKSAAVAADADQSDSKDGRRNFNSFGAANHKPEPTQTLKAIQDATPNDIASIYKILVASFLSLREVLANLPTGIHINIAVLCPSAPEEAEFGIGPSYNINNFADAILTDVFDHARASREKNPDFMRSIVFTSYNPNVCTALNWKQPNYPVLLCNDLGADRDLIGSPTSTNHGTDGKVSVQGSSRASTSIKESARIAQANNFMGVICHSNLLDMVPSLAESIKELGLVLVADMSDETEAQANARVGSGTFEMPDGVNGVMHGNGVLRFNETIDM